MTINRPIVYENIIGPPKLWNNHCGIVIFSNAISMLDFSLLLLFIALDLHCFFVISSFVLFIYSLYGYQLSLFQLYEVQLRKEESICKTNAKNEAER